MRISRIGTVPWTARRALFSLALLSLAAPLGLFAACDSSTDRTKASASTDVLADAGSDVSDDATTPSRTMVERPLFGDTHPQNLFIDPTFSVRRGGLGTWTALTEDTSQTSPTYSGSLMSDSPAGIAMPVGRLSDAKASTKNYRLTLFTQVPGGPGPYDLRVWLSTLDATASASITKVTIGLLLSLDSGVTELKEDASKAMVLGGRTWHLFDGEIQQDLELGAFVLFEFPARTNTWLLQSPEFIPDQIKPSPNTEQLWHRPAEPPRPVTAYEESIVARYRLQPRISVPAGHPSITDRTRDQYRR